VAHLLISGSGRLLDDLDLRRDPLELQLALGEGGREGFGTAGIGQRRVRLSISFRSLVACFSSLTRSALAVLAFRSSSWI
jgi:hypothetical protein